MDANALAEDVALVKTTLRELVQIGAPTGREEKRVDFIEKWLAEHGVSHVRRDEIHNLWVDLDPGCDRMTLIDAHTDTVFSDERLTVREEGERWYCPGIKDNTAACAMLMVLAKRLVALGKPLPLILSFTVGEEGQGDLRGIKEVTRQLKGRLRQGLILDLSMVHMTRQAVGSVRFRVRFKVPGGHSWGKFGEPSALHVACEWIARLKDFAPWKREELSYNVGRLEGGTTVNAIAEEAVFLLDLRSVDPERLNWLCAAAPESLEKFAAAIPDVSVEIERIGWRPAGHIDASHPLAQCVREVHAELNLPLSETISGTNANWLLHEGIPALCTGFVIGENIHTRDEYLEPSSLEQGWAKLWKLTQAAALL